MLDTGKMHAAVEITSDLDAYYERKTRPSAITCADCGSGGAEVEADTPGNHLTRAGRRVRAPRQRVERPAALPYFLARGSLHQRPPLSLSTPQLAFSRPAMRV